MSLFINSKLFFLKTDSRTISFILEEINTSGGIKIMTEIMNTLSINNFNVTLYVINSSQEFYPLNKKINLKYLSLKKNKFALHNIYKTICLVRSLEGIIFVTNFRVSVLCSIFRNKSNSIIFFLVQGMDKISLIQNTENNYFLKKINNLIYYLSTKVDANRIFVSNYLKSVYKKNGFVIPNYCSEIFYSNATINILKDPIKIGLVSTSSPNKGFNLFIEIKKIITSDANFKNFNFLFECATQDMKLINSFSNDISFVKPLNEFEMSKFYNSCNIILSLSYSEGFNLPVVEAMASGRVVIATNDGATSELIKNGFNGILLNSRDPFTFVNEIFSIIQNKSQYLKISKNAIISSRKFSLENFRASYLGLFN